MIYDLNKYRRIVKPVVKDWIDYQGIDKLTESMLAISTGCPIIAICYFIGELYGFNPELLAKIAKLEKFYKVIEVRGKYV